MNSFLLLVKDSTRKQTQKQMKELQVGMGKYNLVVALQSLHTVGSNLSI